MPQQLIYTSIRRGLDIGRSGYCTVARTQNMRKPLIAELEGMSRFDFKKNATKKIFSHRIITIGGERFYVCSCSSDCGFDYTGRTNFISHHVVFAEDEIHAFNSPANFILNWSGWKTSWEGDARDLTDADFPRFMPKAYASQEWTRISKSTEAMPLNSSMRYVFQDVSENSFLKLLAESLDRNGQGCWDIEFSTRLQEGESPRNYNIILADASIGVQYLNGYENFYPSKYVYVKEVKTNTRVDVVVREGVAPVIPNVAENKNNQDDIFFDEIKQSRSVFPYVLAVMIVLVLGVFGWMFYQFSKSESEVLQDIIVQNSKKRDNVVAEQTKSVEIANPKQTSKPKTEIVVNVPEKKVAEVKKVAPKKEEKVKEYIVDEDVKKLKERLGFASIEYGNVQQIVVVVREKETDSDDIELYYPEKVDGVPVKEKVEELSKIAKSDPKKLHVAIIDEKCFGFIFLDKKNVNVDFRTFEIKDILSEDNEISVVKDIEKVLNALYFDDVKLQFDFEFDDVNSDWIEKKINTFNKDVVKKNYEGWRKNCLEAVKAYLEIVEKKPKTLSNPNAKEPELPKNADEFLLEKNRWQKLISKEVSEKLKKETDIEKRNSKIKTLPIFSEFYLPAFNCMINPKEVAIGVSSFSEESKKRFPESNEKTMSKRVVDVLRRVIIYLNEDFYNKKYSTKLTNKDIKYEDLKTILEDMYKNYPCFSKNNSERVKLEKTLGEFIKQLKSQKTKEKDVRSIKNKKGDDIGKKIETIDLLSDADKKKLSNLAKNIEQTLNKIKKENSFEAGYKELKALISLKSDDIKECRDAKKEKEKNQAYVELSKSFFGKVEIKSMHNKALIKYAKFLLGIDHFMGAVKKIKEPWLKHYKKVLELTDILWAEIKNHEEYVEFKSNKEKFENEINQLKENLYNIYSIPEKDIEECLEYLKKTKTLNNVRGKVKIKFKQTEN